MAKRKLQQNIAEELRRLRSAITDKVSDHFLILADTEIIKELDDMAVDLLGAVVLAENLVWDDSTTNYVLDQLELALIEELQGELKDAQHTLSERRRKIRNSLKGKTP